jgi:hypothetical protein
MRALPFVLSGLCLVSFLACQGETPPPPPPVPEPHPAPRKPPADAGLDGGAKAAADGGAADGGTEDLGNVDVGATDAGATDGGNVDAGEPADAWADVSSKPPGAAISVDGVPVGTTPMKVPLASGKKQLVEVSLDGHVTAEREVEPGHGDTVVLAFALEPGARLEVTSDPPGASVTVNGRVVLERTPGVTKSFPPGPIEVVVRSPGYDDFTKKLRARKGVQKLDAKLLAKVKVRVTSSPPGASVTLDGQDAGVTPTELLLSRKGRYTLQVTKAGFSTVKKVLTKPDGDPVDFKLTDLELQALEAKVAKALKAYDAANAALQAAQRRAQENPALGDQLEKAEERMAQATTALEEAESALAAAKARRAH